MDEQRFIHLRDKNRKLKISVGYLRNKDSDNLIHYAIVVAAPSEKDHIINTKEARNKIGARLKETKKNPVNIPWRPWQGPRPEREHVKHSHGEKSPYAFIQQEGLYKIGVCEEDYLLARLNVVRQRIDELNPKGKERKE